MKQNRELQQITKEEFEKMDWTANTWYCSNHNKYWYAGGNHPVYCKDCQDEKDNPTQTHKITISDIDLITVKTDIINTKIKDIKEIIEPKLDGKWTSEFLKIRVNSMDEKFKKLLEEVENIKEYLEWLEKGE